jgi:DNA-binding NarL/FixJ family response regulator
VNDQVIRLLVIDDNASLREMVSRLLNGLEGIAVVGQCSDGSEAMSMAAQATPDVVLMDMNMPVMQGPEVTRRLLQAQPTVRVLMLSVSRSPEDVIAARGAGAAGYLVKDGNIGLLVAAIQTVAAGGTAWPPAPPQITALRGCSSAPTFMTSYTPQWH